MGCGADGEVAGCCDYARSMYNIFQAKSSGPSPLFASSTHWEEPSGDENMSFCVGGPCLS